MPLPTELLLSAPSGLVAWRAVCASTNISMKATAEPILYLVPTAILSHWLSA